MTEKVQTHQTSVALVQEVPAEVDAGTDIVLQVKVSCASGCDLRGKPVKVMAPDGAVMTSELAKFEENVNETEGFAFKAPKQVGEFTWSVVFPCHEAEGIVHEESSTPLSFRTRPHRTSMAVWDIPLPVTIGSLFKIKVGVKCSATCQLTDQPIEVHDETGTRIGTRRLGETPWPQTSGLYWAEVEVTAPSAEGVYSRIVNFSPPELELPHEGASSKFSFRTARPPEHTVTVEVVDKDSKAPLKNADVLLNIYRGSCDECGVAKVEVPKGKYDLYVSKDDYETFQTSVEVTENITVKAELVFAPRFTG